MIRNNKVKAIVSSLITLLPILAGIILWDILPENMSTHFTLDGSTDGFMGKTFTVFFLPCILLAVHWLCLIVTSIDWKNKGQSKKITNIIFWIIPCTSLFANSITYAVALGREANLEILFPIFIGLLFILMGNYMPKATRNRTFGVRIFYTLGNDENWHKTHRLAGTLMVITGVAVLLTVFLSICFSLITMFVLLAVSMIIMYVYSYRIYKKHQKAGIKYDAVPRSKTEKIVIGITAAIIAIALIIIGILMFTGDITVTYGDTSFKVESTYWSDSEIEYTSVTGIEYRENFDIGHRQNGFASAKLALGAFKNDEFGSYVLYAYTDSDSAVIIKVGEKVLAVGGMSDSHTLEIYNTLSDKVQTK